MSAPRLVGGRYELGELIGYGGMAEVHRGRDIRLGREVAIKILRSDLARDPSFQNRFRREAQAAAGLNHPAIVAVYDTGEDGDPAENPSPYIVMEFVEGRTLRDVLKSEGQLPARRAMEITAEVCGALDFSHRSGIVHRDIKPGNVMITNTGAVKVMDFGIARALADNAATVTATSAVIGTAQYLSPEQARGESVDARSDVYSTGCLLYELLTGHPPFTGDSPVAVAYQHVRENPRIPSSENPAVPRALDSIVMKALAKNPMNRYQTAAEMRTDLQRAIAGQAVEAEMVMTDEERTQYISRPAVAAAAAPASRPGVFTPVYDDEDDHRGHRGAVMWVSVIVALLLVIGGTSYLLLRRNNENKSPTLYAVPKLVGLTQAAANDAIRKANLTPASGDPDGSHGPCTSGGDNTDPVSVQKNRVCTQNPKEGEQVTAGTTISFTLYSGPAPVQVPQVTNLTQDAAQKQLNGKGLKVKVQTVHSTQPAGTVIDQDPSPFAEANPGDTVTIQVSDGKAKLPSVLGKTYEEARTTLQRAGWLNVKKVTAVVADGYKVGQVQSMDPAEGTYLDPQTTITLTVATPKPLPPCPTPSTTPPASSPGTSPPTSPSPSTTPPSSSTPSSTASPTCTPSS